MVSGPVAGLQTNVTRGEELKGETSLALRKAQWPLAVFLCSPP